MIWIAFSISLTFHFYFFFLSLFLLFPFSLAFKFYPQQVNDSESIQFKLHTRMFEGTRNKCRNLSMFVGYSERERRGEEGIIVSTNLLNRLCSKIERTKKLSF